MIKKEIEMVAGIKVEIEIEIEILIEVEIKIEIEIEGRTETETEIEIEIGIEIEIEEKKVLLAINNFDLELVYHKLIMMARLNYAILHLFN